MSLNYLATRFTCSWPWETLVLLCDGRIVCGCADPYAHRVLGDARTTTVNQIWTGETISGVRRDMNSGGSTFCGDCPLKLPLADGEAPRHPALAGGGAAAAPAVCRVHGRVQSVLLSSLLRAGDGHQPHAPGGHARFRAV